MREVAIKKICSKFDEYYNIELENVVALDFFARGADWQTQYYAKKVKKIYAWEINPKFEQELKQNLPANADITIGDSFELATHHNNCFDMVVLDNPQGCFGKDNTYCEHFEALEISLNLLKNEGGLLVFNVKTEPFNYTNKLEWQKRRNNFYSLKDCSKLSESFVIEFYTQYFERRGFKVKFCFIEERPQETGLCALTVNLQKVQDDN